MLNSPPDEGEQLASFHGCLTAVEKNPNILLMEGWLGHSQYGGEEEISSATDRN
jgi:hypothetical protein